TLNTNLKGVNSLSWRLYLRLSDLVDPGPTRTALFWDQREDSVNLGNFFIDMTGYPNFPSWTEWYQDLPAVYHGNAGRLSFADGHWEIRRWRDRRTMLPVRPGIPWLLNWKPMPQPGNSDIIWLQDHATRQQ